MEPRIWCGQVRAGWRRPGLRRRPGRARAAYRGLSRDCLPIAFVRQWVVPGFPHLQFLGGLDASSARATTPTKSRITTPPQQCLGYMIVDLQCGCCRQRNQA